MEAELSVGVTCLRHIQKVRASIAPHSFSWCLILRRSPLYVISRPAF